MLEVGMVRIVQTEGTRRWRQGDKETSRYRHVGLSRAIGEKTTLQGTSLVV